MVPRMGPGEDGSILLNEMPPILGPANEQGGATLKVYELFVLCCGTLLSLRVTVKVKSPDWTGVPDISAVSDGDGDGVKNRPGGRLPDVIDQEYGVVPFDPDKVAEYGVLTWPFGRLFGDIFKGGAAKAGSAVPARMNKRERAVRNLMDDFGLIAWPRRCPLREKTTALAHMRESICTRAVKEKRS